MGCRTVAGIYSEADLEKYGKKQLQSIGCLVYKFVSPTKRGVPDDITVCPDGRVFFIEYKTPNGTGKLSKLQELQIAKLRANNATVLVINSVKEVDALVKAIVSTCDA